MKKIILALCSFGLLVGAVFPILTKPFVNWIPGRILPFIAACLIAGCLVGLFGYLIINAILKSIDSYYKKTLFEKLDISEHKEPNVESDLLLNMRSEFEALINRFSAYVRQENDRLRELANLDSLTSLYNHEYIFEYFNCKVTHGCKAMAVLFCDIDHFKLLNDNQGHPAGDLVLKKVGSILEDSVGNDGDVFRYGGEEFVAILHRLQTLKTLSKRQTRQCILPSRPEGTGATAIHKTSNPFSDPVGRVLLGGFAFLYFAKYLLQRRFVGRTRNISV